MTKRDKANFFVTKKAGASNSAPPPAEKKPSRTAPFFPYAGEAALLLVLILFGWFRMHFLEMPLERDEGSYAYMAQLLLDGQKPYVNFYEMKPPALFYAYAGLVGIFGASTKGLHLAFLCLNLAGAILLYTASDRLFNKKAALAATIVYLQLSLSPVASGYTAQAEHIVNFHLIGSLFCLAVALKSGRRWPFLVAGLLFGTAIMTKQIALAFAPAILALLWKREAEHHWKPLALRLAFVGIGTAAAILLWLISIAIQGSWQDMMFWLVQYPKAYASVFTWAERRGVFWDMLGLMVRSFPLIWTLAAISLVLSLRMATEKGDRFFPAALIFSAFVAVFPGYYFYGHYWLYFAPALALAVAAVMDLAQNPNKIKSLSYGPVLLTGIVTLLFFTDFFKHKDYYLSPNLKQIMRVAYSDNPFPEIDQIGKQLLKRAQPGDQLIVMGSEPQLNFTTGMRSPTRHFFMGFLTKGRAEEAAWIKEAKGDIQKAKPRFLVMVHHPFSWSYFDNVKRDMFDFGYQFANQYYTPIGLADMQPQGTKYSWDESVKDFKPYNGKFVLVYELKRVFEPLRD